MTRYTHKPDERSPGAGTAMCQALRDADSRIPVSFNTEARQVEQTIWRERTFATLCTSFGMLAVAIAGVGLCGMIANSVGRRTNGTGFGWRSARGGAH